MKVTGPTDVPKHQHLIAKMNGVVILKVLKKTYNGKKEILLSTRYGNVAGDRRNKVNSKHKLQDNYRMSSFTIQRVSFYMKRCVLNLCRIPMSLGWEPSTASCKNFHYPASTANLDA